MNDFYRTRMGHMFFESTLPRIATALERIAAALEKRPEATEGVAPDTEMERDGAGRGRGRRERPTK